MLACALFVVVVAGTGVPSDAQAAQPAGDAGPLRDARSQTAPDLLARARVELSAAPAGNLAAEKQALAKAETWLRQALAQQPHDYLALLELGEVLVRQGRAGEALPTLEGACALARGPNEVFPCSLRLAAARAHAGQFAQALAEYDRHLEISDPRTLPAVHAKAAELLMALGRLGEAQARFEKAIGLLDQGQYRFESQRALALYGLAMAQDRAGRGRDARQTTWRALVVDPGLALLAAASDPYSGAALVPAEDVHYATGLALAIQGEGAAAMRAFKRFVAAAPDSRWRKQAEGHLLELAAAGTEEPPQPPRHASVVAAATVRADGPLPAPLIDAAWRSRPRLLEPCMGMVPDSAPATLRLSLSLTIDGRGALRRVALDLGPDVGFGVSPGWRGFETCVLRRVKSGLRIVRPARQAVTSARLELVLAIRGQGAAP